MRLQRTFIVGLVAAGALGAGLLLSPASAAQAAKAATITVSGTALLPDGAPGASLPVSVMAPTKELQKGATGDAPGVLLQDKSKSKEGAMLKPLAKGMTDAQGKFALKFEAPAQGDQTVTLQIGDATKTAWAKQQVVTKGKDVDLGNIQLKAPVAK